MHVMSDAHRHKILIIFVMNKVSYNTCKVCVRSHVFHCLLHTGQARQWPVCDRRRNIQQFARGQIDIKGLSYHAHCLTSVPLACLIVCMYCVLHSFVGLARPPTWILGVLLLREARGGEEAKKGKEWEGTKRGREGKGGPSPFPIRYTTALGEPFAASGTLGDLTWLEDFLTSKWPSSFTALAPPLDSCRLLIACQNNISFRVVQASSVECYSNHID